MNLYHSGNRDLQDQFGSRNLADRLQGFARTTFSADDRSFITSLPYFFLASADAVEGQGDAAQAPADFEFARDRCSVGSRLDTTEAEEHRVRLSLDEQGRATEKTVSAVTSLVSELAQGIRSVAKAA